jgi:hypothetical protein
MLEQGSPEQPSRDSGSLPLEDRISSALFGTPKPQPKPQQSAPEEAPVEANADADPADVSEVQEESAADPAPEPETFEYEYEGEKFVLPKKLEKSVMQERDYTQKNQSLADQRRLVEVKEQQFRERELQQNFHNEIANEIRQMQMIDAVLEQPVNWQTMSTDDAFRHKIQLDELKQQRDKLAKAVDEKYQGYQKQQAETRAALQTKTLEALKSLIPSWGPEVAKEVTTHFRERGLSEADFQFLNSRPEFVQAAWEAMQYRKLQSKAKPAVQQAKVAKTTSAKPMPQSVKEHLNFRKQLAKAPEGSPERRKVLEARAASIFSR